ncbi:hypothetical protein CHS0354_016598 [Potamilus streckersoni]|uniref:Coiled-coil domain-containing protein 15 n=1 Tax=Potamilus streckersoni TaxID=2493646 RepID=A0AAE0THD9_9BIVA|nr:hypothetical protein CHS0354_016598 [Potamilus streckersoni]
MATQTRRVLQVSCKISKPVISSDVMGNRNVEIRAVGAWVQPETDCIPAEGVIAAAEEESRLCEIQSQKEARLKKFQEEVRRRVRSLDRTKKQLQMQTNYQALEHERSIVQQSAFPVADTRISRQDKCILRRPNGLALRPSSAPVCQDDSSFLKNEASTQAFSDQTNQIHKTVRHARRHLISKKFITDNFVKDDLPGGIWRVSKTRDFPSSRATEDGNVISLEDDLECAETEGYNDMENREHKVVKTVQFDLEPNKEDIKHEKRPRKTGIHSHPNIHQLQVPDIYTGIQTESEKQRQKNQQALYRRLFMDLEREQVKENLRRQEHRKRIERLKKDKEEERNHAEQMARQLIEPRDPVTGETPEETLERESQGVKFVQQTLKKHEAKIRKARELQRYVEALRQQLKEKIRKKNIELPPLCLCGDSIWDTNPETCANNCVFYKNPRGYARALQSLLSSSEIA